MNDKLFRFTKNNNEMDKIISLNFFALIVIINIEIITIHSDSLGTWACASMWSLSSVGLYSVRAVSRELIGYSIVERVWSLDS